MSKPIPSLPPRRGDDINPFANNDDQEHVVPRGSPDAMARTPEGLDGRLQTGLEFSLMDYVSSSQRAGSHTPVMTQRSLYDHRLEPEAADSTPPAVVTVNPYLPRVYDAPVSPLMSLASDFDWNSFSPRPDVLMDPDAPMPSIDLSQDSVAPEMYDNPFVVDNLDDKWYLSEVDRLSQPIGRDFIPVTPERTPAPLGSQEDFIPGGEGPYLPGPSSQRESREWWTRERERQRQDREIWNALSPTVHFTPATWQDFVDEEIRWEGWPDIPEGTEVIDASADIEEQTLHGPEPVMNRDFMWPPNYFLDGGGGALGTASLWKPGIMSDDPKKFLENDEDRRERFRFVSANVQKSRANATVLLEQFRDYDFIFFQEIPWGFVKHVPSSKDPEGDSFHHTARHRNFMCLGASETSSVCIHVHKRWEHLMPRIIGNVVNHADICAVAITTPEGPKILLNVYNRSGSNEALEYLSHRAEQLPDIIAMAGDWNLHSAKWGPSGAPYGDAIKRDRPHVAKLMDVVATLNLDLVNNKGISTWKSNNLLLRPQVIDLIWVPLADIQKTEHTVSFTGVTTASDHAVLTWTMTNHVIWPSREPRIKPDSIEADEYAAHLQREFATLDDPDLYLTDALVHRTARWIGRTMEAAWDAHASVPSFNPARSKSWWSSECSEAASCLKAAKLLGRATIVDSILRRKAIKKAGRWLKGAVRRAQRAFFDGILQKTQSNGKIWDLVRWTKQRPDDSFSTLIQSDGSPASSAEEVFDTFSKTFYPERPNDIYAPVVDSYPQLPIREDDVFSKSEFLLEIVSTSNTSSPGLDHCGWGLLKLVLKDVDAVAGICAFFNACFNRGIWPEIFKTNVTVVIPKPGKDDYSKAKSYRPISTLR